MNQKNSPLYEKTFKQFVLGILYYLLISIVCALYLYSPLRYPFNYLLFLEVAIHIIAIVVVHIIPAVYIKKLVRLYVIFLFAGLFPATVLELSTGTVNLLFWYIDIPVCVYVVFPGKKAAKWTGYIFLLVVLEFVLSQLFRRYCTSILYSDIYPCMNISSIHLFLGNVICAFSALLLVCYGLYYVHRFHKIQISGVMEMIDLTNDEKEKYLLETRNEEEEKCRQLYVRVVEYFTSKQPYLQEDFSLTQMAHDLDVNPAYLSKAINSIENMNFNCLVNFYRVEKVKKLMQQKDSQKYTLEHIYLSSGFRNQSSFNRAFKKQEGITPSEYLKQYVENSNDVDEKKT